MLEKDLAQKVMIYEVGNQNKDEIISIFIFRCKLLNFGLQTTFMQIYL